MPFRVTNFTVTTALLLAFTVAMMVVRQKKPLENNWPMLYWVLVAFYTLVRPEETFNLGVILVGLAAGMLLRFEFMNRPITVILKVVEFVVWSYILIRGINVIMA